MVKRIPQSNYMTKDMCNGVLKVMVLSMVKHGKYYPYLLFKTLERSGHSPVNGSMLKNAVYKTLADLEYAGYIKSNNLIEGSKMRKYYKINSKGEDALKQTKKLITKSINDTIITLE